MNHSLLLGIVYPSCFCIETKPNMVLFSRKNFVENWKKYIIFSGRGIGPDFNPKQLEFKTVLNVDKSVANWDTNQNVVQICNIFLQCLTCVTYFTSAWLHVLKATNN